MANRPIVYIGGFLDSTAPTLLLNTHVICTISTTALSTPSWPLLIWPLHQLLGPFYVIWPLLHLLGPSTMALLHLPGPFFFYSLRFLKTQSFHVACFEKRNVFMLRFEKCKAFRLHVLKTQCVHIVFLKTQSVHFAFFKMRNVSALRF